MQREHEELAARIEHRLAKIEEKLDKHLESVTKHSADISWVKGYIRISVTMISTIIVGVVGLVLKVFIK